jgi:hypothetical protein
MDLAEILTNNNQLIEHLTHWFWNNQLLIVSPMAPSLYLGRIISRLIISL